MRRRWMLVTGVVLTVLGTIPGSGQPLALSEGTPLVYEHIPRILTAGETGTIRVIAEVAGDVPTALFRRNVPTLSGGVLAESWTRSTTRTVDGRVVSVFDRSYPGSILADLLVYAHGTDRPQVPLGRLEVPGSNDTDPNGASVDSSFLTVWLKLASSSLPTSMVRVLASQAGDEPVGQYASHVVNLVIPGFGDSRVSNGPRAFEFEEAAETFYRHFSDSYHALSFIPRRSPFMSYGALNINVKNDVAGIGAALFDDQAAYGSGMLRSVQLFAAGFAGQQEMTVHQLGHHWGDETNLAAIAGVASAGRQPERHTPLLHEGATWLGAVLEGSREVERVPSVESGGIDLYRIRLTSAPVMFHPLQLYRMGLLEAAAVPDVTVFADQAQFRSTETDAPAAGTPVTGAQRTVNINQIMAALGTRTGPTFTLWRQAFIVVSDELISQEEMDYYNFYAQRASAPTGTRSFDGYGSFFEATGGRVTLETDIETLDAGSNPKVTETLQVSDVAFGARDWRGLVFDPPVPSRLVSGASVTLRGRIDTATLPGSYQFIILRAVRFGDAPATAKTAQARVNGGRFAVPLRFTSAEAGAYAIDAFVFEDADSQAIPTSVVTPLFVD
ncbi:MAG: hypothetical protein QF681_08125 [Vicinamibacterales bacterium]|nr:hypothetical protein [Vicinamibacterales bacterium]